MNFRQRNEKPVVHIRRAHHGMQTTTGRNSDYPEKSHESSRGREGDFLPKNKSNCQRELSRAAGRSIQRKGRGSIRGGGGEIETCVLGDWMDRADLGRRQFPGISGGGAEEFRWGEEHRRSAREVFSAFCWVYYVTCSSGHFLGLWMTPGAHFPVMA